MERKRLICIISITNFNLISGFCVMPPFNNIRQPHAIPKNRKKQFSIETHFLIKLEVAYG